jgi:DNA-binding transcriptional ArsR family regulator
MNITKSLADKNRVRIIMALGDKELCVCQLIELLDLAPSTVSKHLSILKNARLVDSRKKGRWIYYRLNDQKEPPETKTALSWVFKSIEDTLQIQTDAKRLEEILRIDPEVLCSRQV